MPGIRGITILLINQSQTGTDNFGTPIYTETTEEVENVLVAPVSTEDADKVYSLHGKKARYTLAIPKGDTHTWTDKKVRFFGQTFMTIGYPEEGIESMIPLHWNKKVMVEEHG